MQEQISDEAHHEDEFAVQALHAYFQPSLSNPSSQENTNITFHG